MPQEGTDRSDYRTFSSTLPAGDLFLSSAAKLAVKTVRIQAELLQFAVPLQSDCSSVQQMNRQVGSYCLPQLEYFKPLWQKGLEQSNIQALRAWLKKGTPPAKALLARKGTTEAGPWGL